MLNVLMLGSGFIGQFYAKSIIANRNKDKIIGVYSRRAEMGQKFKKEFGCEFWENDLEKAISNSKVDIVCVALPNHLHLQAVQLCCNYKKPVIMTKPLARNGQEAFKILQMVEQAGIFNGYLEDLVYTPKNLKAQESVKNGAIGQVLWAKSRETHPGPHSDWFWDIKLAGGGCILDLGCHCIEIARNFIGKNIKPLEVMCWAETQVKPIQAEDHGIGLVKYQSGAIGQFETSWCFKGGMDLRDEVMGTDGTIWINSFLRTGFEMFSLNSRNNYIAEKVELDKGWLFPVGDEINELGYNHMFADMFSAFEQNRQPQETFYDGYIVNAIIDACYISAKSKKWEPVDIKDWRGQQSLNENSFVQHYNDEYFLVKEELTHYGQKKRILKHKISGNIIEEIS